MKQTENKQAERSPPDPAVPSRETWEEYERRKRELQRMRLPADEYDRAIDALTRELNL